MVRGFKIFKCEKCGEVFKGIDMEWNATAFSAPVPCPNCGNMTNNTASIIDRIKYHLK